MTGTELCVNLATSVPVIFEPPCIFTVFYSKLYFEEVDVSAVTSTSL